MIKILGKYGLIGVPIGLLGFLFEGLIVQSLFFVAGGALCFASYYAGVIIRSGEKLEKEKKSDH